ncbi:MAG TPA: hypothetical protein VNJ01_01085 [Bacteriovoracaceae bacterium]|nr:hypothetical protein [Bacteriovoracaceae bacterium]
MRYFNAVILNFALISAAVAAPLGIDHAWDGVSDPLIMSSKFERKFSKLPATGKAKDETKFWSGDYWALFLGNINYRWNAEYKTGFNLKSPSKQTAMSMSESQLASLAPSEKYDLLTGNYNYPVRNDVYNMSYPNAAEWEGICHGWAPAAMNHSEPMPKILTSVDGIKIPFGSSDIKALLSYYYAYKHEVDNTHQMGERCYGGRCAEDLNAGAFHIVLANKIGLEGVGFIADVDRYWEVWNHPVHSYTTSVVEESSYPYRYSAHGTVKVLRVRTAMSYIDESVGNSWQAMLGTPAQVYKTKNYEYYLDINASNEIIGGEWISAERPDFLWLKAKPAKFVGILSRLGDLLND